MGFLSQHDGCRQHRAKRVAAFLDANGVNVVPCPAQSPDLNPIENVWAIMKGHISILSKYPTTADKLLQHLCEIWNGLPGDYFIKLSHSNIQHCNAIKRLVVVLANIETYLN